MKRKFLWQLTVFLFLTAFVLLLVLVNQNDTQKDVEKPVNSEKTSEVTKEKNNTEEHSEHDKVDIKTKDNHIDQHQEEAHENHGSDLISVWKKSDTFKINLLTFDKPTSVGNLTDPNTSTRLLDTNDRYFVFRSHGGYLYVADLLKSKYYIIEKEGVSHATLSNHALFYIKDQKIHKYDLERSKNLGSFYSVENKNIIKLIFSETLIYTYVNNKNTYTSIVLMLADEQYISLFEIEHKDSFFKFINSKFYFYNDEKNGMEFFPSEDGKKINFTFKKNLNDVANFDLNTKNEWLVVNQDQSRLFGEILTKDGIVSDFDQVAYAQWLGENSIILLENKELVVFDLKTKKKHLLYRGVYDFKVTQSKHIVINTVDRGVLVIKNTSIG